MDGVFKKTFKEITQPIQQNPLGMGGFEFHVVAEHRGELLRGDLAVVRPRRQIVVAVVLVVVVLFMFNSADLRSLMIMASFSMVLGLFSKVRLRSSCSISNTTHSQRAFTVALLGSSLKTLISPKNAGLSAYEDVQLYILI